MVRLLRDAALILIPVVVCVAGTVIGFNFAGTVLGVTFDVAERIFGGSFGVAEDIYGVSVDVAKTGFSAIKPGLDVTFGVAEELPLSVIGYIFSLIVAIVKPIFTASVTVGVAVTELSLFSGGFAGVVFGGMAGGYVGLLIAMFGAAVGMISFILGMVIAIGLIAVALVFIGTAVTVTVCLIGTVVLYIGSVLIGFVFVGAVFMVVTVFGIGVAAIIAVVTFPFWVCRMWIL